MKKRRMLACLALAVGWLLLTAPKALADTAMEDYIRLHIVAASNSAWDQGVKLAVRDAVRREAASILGECASPDEAWTLLQKDLETLESAARAVLDEWGATCGASASAGVYAFPDRVYGAVTVPAGEYRAIRIVLGSGEGKNWWCVLFPSLCLPADADDVTPVVFYSSLGRWLARLLGRSPI